jgi:hypothetical protein
MTTQSKILAIKVEIVLVDPWDFVTANGSGPFIADVIQSDRDTTSGDAVAFLLELSLPLKHQTSEYRYFIATPRHEGVTFDRLLSGATVGSNLTGIPEDRARSTNPFDLSWWRGGAAAIADVSLHR